MGVCPEGNPNAYLLINLKGQQISPHQGYSPWKENPMKRTWKTPVSHGLQQHMAGGAECVLPLDSVGQGLGQSIRNMAQEDKAPGIQQATRRDETQAVKW